ncbi:unnamed protein product [Urochloa humidicola]
MEDIHGGEPWSNRKTVGSGESVATSSSSGNTLSTYQHTSGSGSFPFPLFIFDQVVVEQEQPPGSCQDDDEARQRSQHMKGLLEEFCGNSSAALRRWFSDLGITWVLRIADQDDAPARLPLLQDQRTFAARWIQALADITESILDAYDSCFSHSHLVSLPEDVEATIPDPAHFSRFIQETMLKMLSFVDAIAAPNPNNTICIEEIITDSNGVPAPLEKLKTLLDVRGAVFMASFLIQPLLLHLPSSSAQAESCRTTLLEDMEALRTQKDGILAEAIWNTMQEVTAAILADDGHHDSWDTPQGSSASIHKVTRSVERYIRLLEINYRSVDQIVRKAADCGAYVPETCNANPFTSMMTEMVSCLEEKLAKMSQSFPNKSLGLLFLINNLHSLWQQLHPMYDTKFNMPVLTRKIEDYIDKYLQEAWAPVVARLHSSSPSTLQFGRRYFPLSKFESEFRKVYNDQKLWKVPDPELRKRQRKAITDKVASGFTSFLEENTVSTRGSTITLQEVEDMLQELFEG